MAAGICDRYYPRATRPGGADTREPTIALADALLLEQLHQAGGSVPDLHVATYAREQLHRLVGLGWVRCVVAVPGVGTQWMLTSAGQQVRAEVGGARPVVVP